MSFRLVSKSANTVGKWANEVGYSAQFKDDFHRTPSNFTIPLSKEFFTESEIGKDAGAKLMSVVYVKAQGKLYHLSDEQLRAWLSIDLSNVATEKEYYALNRSILQSITPEPEYVPHI